MAKKKTQRASSPLKAPHKDRGERVDALLVSRGLAPNLGKAQALIMAGEVIVGERRVDKAGERLSPDAPLRLRPRRGHGYVGRGGLKMEWALRHFALNPQGLTCLDLGLSTGGFTDCLLQRGAARAYGVDVGKGLAHERLVRDPRAVVLEGLHVKDLTAEHIPEPCDLCVADISFNSLTRIVAPALPFLKPGATLLLLVKPQFELSAEVLEESASRGVVMSEEAREEACALVARHLEALGLEVKAWAPCGVKGTKGNQEYFLRALKST